MMRVSFQTLQMNDTSTEIFVPPPTIVRQFVLFNHAGRSVAAIIIRFGHVRNRLLIKQRRKLIPACLTRRWYLLIIDDRESVIV